VHDLVLRSKSLQGSYCCHRFFGLVLCSHAYVHFLQFLEVEFSLRLLWGSDGRGHFAGFDSLYSVTGRDSMVNELHKLYMSTIALHWNKSQFSHKKL
jgi:hypothetical protein